MGEGCFAQLRGVAEALVGEALQVGGLADAVFEDVAHHRAAAGLRPYGLHLQAAVGLAHIEERVDHLQFAANALPVEQLLVFGCGEMNQHSVVGSHAFNQHIGQFVAPELVQGAVVCGFEGDVVLHTIGRYAVHRAQQAIEEARYPEVLLGKGEFVVAERIGAQMLVRLTIVGQEGGHLFGKGKLLEALLIGRCDFRATAEARCEFIRVHPRHFCGKHVADGLKAGHGGRLAVRVLVHDFGVGKEYLHGAGLLVYRDGVGAGLAERLSLHRHFQFPPHIHRAVRRGRHTSAQGFPHQGSGFPASVP